LPDGTPVPIAVARMLACASGCVDVTVDERGELLGVGRRSRSIPAAIGRALWLRDGGCRVPGCGRRRHMHGHHLRGWAEGGETKLDNLVLLCAGHHRMVGRWTWARLQPLDRREHVGPLSPTDPRAYTARRPSPRSCR
jgi:hypothetical protein